MLRLAVRALVVLVATACAGCMTRDTSVSLCFYRALAHPTMTPEPLPAAFDDRVRAVSEGATNGHGD